MTSRSNLLKYSLLLLRSLGGRAGSEWLLGRGMVGNLCFQPICRIVGSEEPLCKELYQMDDPHNFLFSCKPFSLLEIDE